MAATSTCPKPKDLERLLSGQMGDVEAEQLEGHVSQCGHCLETVRTLKPDDTLI